jgi:hypothetical protein
MEKLEDIIRSNRESFNEEEPANGHFERFEQRLEKLHNKPLLHIARPWMKVAAGLLILLTSALVIMELTGNRDRANLRPDYSTLGLPAEVVNMLAEYDRKTSSQMDEIREMAANCPDGTNLVSYADREVKPIDNEMAELLSGLRSNPFDKRLQIALLENYQAKEMILNNVILDGTFKKCE